MAYMHDLTWHETKRNKKKTNKHKGLVKQVNIQIVNAN